MKPPASEQHLRLVELLGDKVALRWSGMRREEKLEAIAEASADRLDLPRNCVRCGNRLCGLERSRLGVWNGSYGALCDNCGEELTGDGGRP